MNFENILDALCEGIVIIDKKGRIEFFNKAYEKFTGFSLKEVKGELLKCIRPGALLPDAVSEGKALIGKLRSENGQEYFASMYPVYDHGEVCGGVSIVTFIENAEYFAQIMSSLKQKESYLKERMATTNGTVYTFDSIVYGSDITEKCIAAAKKIAHTDVHILVQGESGCGKELYAQSIHNESERKEYPFIAVNCAALNRDILESELFGYEAGAFTGARKSGKIGLFEAAEHGTIFLDEVSEMDFELQAKLLRALQEKRIRRIGGTKEISIDVRVISACNVDLLNYIEQNRFRMDLYYRIAVIPLQILPLRERKGDLKPLIDKHLKKISIQQKKIISITDEVLEVLLQYNWPGNVRELYNVLEYAALMSATSQIEIKDLPAAVLKNNFSFSDTTSLAVRTRQFEKREIIKLLDLYGYTVEG